MENDIRRAWLDDDTAVLSPGRAAKHRLTEQVRRLIDATFQLAVDDSGHEATVSVDAKVDANVGADADTNADTDRTDVEALDRLTAEAANLVERIAALPRIPRGTVDGQNTSQARRIDALLVERSTINGRANPLSPPVRMWADGDLVRAEAFFTAPYEGPPGRVHGAWVAACFDEIVGCAQGASGAFSFTGTLTVTMRRATPLYTKITYEAGFSHREGRKIHGWGKCYANGELTAEATGIFVIPLWAAG